MSKTAGQTASAIEHERSLLARIAAQDGKALESLYRLYHPRLFKFVYRLTRSYAAADELVNDIMYIIWKNASKFRGDSKVSTWIFGIAYRQTMQRLSKKKLVLVPFAEAENISDEGARDLEQEDWVRRALNDLSDAQQITVLLVFYLGLSYNEAAEVTDSPVNTVKTRMFHAKKKLRELLQAPASAGNGNGI